MKILSLPNNITEDIVEKKKKRRDQRPALETMCCLCLNQNYHNQNNFTGRQNGSFYPVTFCTCPKPGSGFLMSYVVVFFVFTDLR
jgi:hypothetical protein